MSKYAVALSKLASPLAFGGPGSGRRPGGGSAAKDEADKLSADAHVASSKAYETADPEKHVDAMYAHKKAAIAQHEVGNHRRGELHENTAINHATIHDESIKQAVGFKDAGATNSAKPPKNPKAYLSLVSPLALVQNTVTSPQVTEKVSEPELSLLAFASTEPNPLYPGQASEEVGNAQAPQTQKNCCRFSKDVLAEGKFSHPTKKWSLDIDGKVNDRLCAAFDAMKADGVKVPIYADHNPSATTHLGYITGLCRGGPEALKKYPELAKLPADRAPLNPKKLYAVHEFNDEKAAALASGVGQVSVLIDKNMQAGNGKKYGMAIKHVAITPEPIVPGQDGFCRFSIDKTDFAAVLLSLVQ